MAFLLAMITAAAVSLAVAARLLPPLLAGLASSRRAPSPGRCEGYWPDAEECLALGSSRPPFRRRTRSNAGCPQWRMNPRWEGRGEVSAKLRDIEGTARAWDRRLNAMDEGQFRRCAGEGPSVRIVRERGMAPSRVEEGVMAGNAEFHSGDVCWTDALLPTYMDKFGVEPSMGFQRFVEGFDLGDFQRRLAKLAECSEEGGGEEL